MKPLTIIIQTKQLQPRIK